MDCLGKMVISFWVINWGAALAESEDADASEGENIFKDSDHAEQKACLNLIVLHMSGVERQVAK